MDIIKIKAPETPKKRGRPPKSLLRKFANPSKLDALASLYEHIAERCQRNGRAKFYGKKNKLIDALAKKYKVDENALVSKIERTKVNRSVLAKQKKKK